LPVAVSPASTVTSGEGKPVVCLPALSVAAPGAWEAASAATAAAATAVFAAPVRSLLPNCAAID
jgi:hypothetical protein